MKGTAKRIHQLFCEWLLLFVVVVVKVLVYTVEYNP